MGEGEGVAGAKRERNPLAPAHEAHGQSPSCDYQADSQTPPLPQPKLIDAE